MPASAALRRVISGASAVLVGAGARVDSLQDVGPDLTEARQMRPLLCCLHGVPGPEHRQHIVDEREGRGLPAVREHAVDVGRRLDPPSGMPSLTILMPSDRNSRTFSLATPFTICSVCPSSCACVWTRPGHGATP